jgi:hypothetical protein
MKNILVVLAVLAAPAFFRCPAVRAQEVTKASVTDQEVELMRQDLRSKRKQIIAANIQMTDAEAEKFWPVYDQYAADQRKAYDIHYGLLKEYAASIDTLTNEQALSLTKRWTEADTAKAQLRTKYFPAFEKVLGAKRAARLSQLDRLLTLMIDVQIASDVPLIKQ